MRINFLIISFLVFDAFAFFRGINYHVSDVYEKCYIKHSITVDEYVFQTSGYKALPSKEVKKIMSEASHQDLILP